MQQNEMLDWIPGEISDTCPLKKNDNNFIQFFRFSYMAAAPILFHMVPISHLKISWTFYLGSSARTAFSETSLIN